MRRGVLVGVFLALLGLAVFLISAIPITRVDEVIKTSFTLSSGSRYGPYDTGTYYHTRVFIFKSVLKGEVLVEGEGIYLTVNGYNTQSLRNIYVEGQESIVIDPANDLYTFTFDNTKGDTESLVRFTLKEVWTGPMCTGSPPLFIAGLTGLFLLLPSGLATFAITYLRTRQRD